MDDILIELHACDPATNRRRAWRVLAGADLFGVWTAQVTFGRIGAAGRIIGHTFADQAAAVAFVRRGLRRRATAVRRIGVAYRPIEAAPSAGDLLALTGLDRPAAATPPTTSCSSVATTSTNTPVAPP